MAGANLVSQEGSHTKWKHPLVPVSTLILSGHDAEDAKPYQVRAVRDLLREIAEARRSAEL
jgi:predicted RNA binding protein YcfA (HicA-like mRNA interferase family)